MSNNPVVKVVGENEDPEIMSLLALTQQQYEETVETETVVTADA